MKIIFGSSDFTSSCLNRHMGWFLLFFFFRYIRVISNIFGNFTYKPSKIPAKPTYTASDVTVLIPTIDIKSPTFHKVLRSILQHSVAKLVIAAAGPIRNQAAEYFAKKFEDQRIIFIHQSKISRREQTASGLKQVTTPLLILQDNHTYWPTSRKFLPSLISPFEDPLVGGVSPAICARHHFHSFSLRAFANFLGMTYLARRFHEYKATNALDGGLSTLTGRFGIFRTEIYTAPDFLHGYLNEYTFFGRVGPLNVDDDKYHSRYLVDHGWKMRLQATPETTLFTELGTWPRFGEQVVRWTRTTWRSNPRQLCHLKSWIRYPYTSFNLFVWGLRVSLLHEAGMFWLLWKGLDEMDVAVWYNVAATILGLWIIILKIAKIGPHFIRYPRDLMWLPGYLLFGYLCTFVKIWALLTCWNSSWTSATPQSESRGKDEAVSSISITGATKQDRVDQRSIEEGICRN